MFKFITRFITVVIEAAIKTVNETAPLWKTALQLYNIERKFYKTVRAKKIEQELYDKYKQFKSEGKEEIKSSAQNIVNNVENTLQKNRGLLSSEEEEEVKDIIKRHSEWINTQL